MKKTSNNSNLFVVIAVVNIAAMLVANISAFKMVMIGPLILPAAVFIFPITYIVGDIIVEVYGWEKAKNVIWLAFTMNLLAVLYFKFTIALPAPGFFEHAGAYSTVLGEGWRILLAGFTAFLTGSYVNGIIMQKMKLRDGEAKFAWRAAVSTVFGESIDAMIFITVAFLGTMPIEALFIMMASQAGFKIIYEIAILPVTSWIVGRIRLAEGI